MGTSRNRRQDGFTIIELLVVTTIIGLLSSVILATVGDARSRGLEAAAQQELQQIVRAAAYAQGQAQGTLAEITGSTGSDVDCQGSDIRNAPAGSDCYVSMAAALDAIENETGGVYRASLLIRDPWGSPYYIDENQVDGSCASGDVLGSAGPDGYLYTADDIAPTEGIPLSPYCS